MSGGPSTWFLANCRSQSTAERHVMSQPTGGFVIWPSPTMRGCLILSTKQNKNNVQHIEIYKKPGGFTIKGSDRLYTSLEMLILSLRKANSKGNSKPEESHAPMKSPRPGKKTESEQKSNSSSKLDRKTPDEQIIKEMQDLFPEANREKIVRATTLAEGDRQKAMDLLLSQSIDSQQQKKVKSLSRVLHQVIAESKPKLQSIHKDLMSLRTVEDMKGPNAKAQSRALAQIQRLLRNFPGRSKQNQKRAAPATPAQRLRQFKEDQKAVASEILGKLMYIDRQIDTGKVSVKKLVEIGGVVKQVKMLLEGAVLAEGSTKGSKSAESSPAQQRNYVIPYSDLVIEKVIGQGAYGKVYKADYKGRQVAVKSMALLKDERERNWMKREISLLKQVRHPNVTEFIGISKDTDNNLLIVMEFIPGGELYALLLDPKVKLTWYRRLKISHDVASALAYMHARNIIHRDIKSENLLVGEGFNVKLCDFGFARAIETRNKARMTMCGSPYFNAPELLLGKAYNEKADVFAFGILLCEIITRGTVNLDRLGKKEFNAYALDIASLRQEISKDCPGPFWKLAVCCVNYEPEKRPSMKQVEKMLTAILSMYAEED